MSRTSMAKPQRRRLTQTFQLLGGVGADRW